MLNEYACGPPICGCAIRLKTTRRIAFASVTVPTVERTLAPIRSWSRMIAVVRPSSESTSGRASVGMKPWTNALYVSLISRCDSAAMVSKTSELLPDPETPVNTVSRRLGIWTLTSLRLFTRAPSTRIMSCRSAVCDAVSCTSVLVALLIVFPSAARGRVLCAGRSAELLDADHVARGVAEGGVAHAVRLLGRLLHDLGAAGHDPLEGAVEVLRGQVDAEVAALGHQFGDGALLVLRQAGGGGRRVQDDGRVGLAGRADRDPAHAAVAHVEADLEAECVAEERHGGVGIGVRQEAGVDGDGHGRHARDGAAAGASRFLTGLVTCFATHAGMPA